MNAPRIEGRFCFEGETLSFQKMLGGGSATATRGVERSETIAAIIDNQGTYVGRPRYSADLIPAYRVGTWANAAIKAIGRACARVPLIAVSLPRARPKVASVQDFKAMHGINNYAEAFEEWMKFEGGEILDKGHPVIDLLNNPNDEAELTRYDLIFATSAFVDLDGNSYWEKVFKTEREKEVVALWPKIDPRQMLPVPGETNLIDGWMFYGGGKVIWCKKNHIIHFEEFNPESPFFGLGSTKVLRSILIGDVRAQDYNRMFFEHGAEPLGLLKTDKTVTDTTAKSIKRRWDESHQGTGRSFQTAVLGSGFEYQQTGLSHKEMAFKELRMMNREEILAVYGVPAVMVTLAREQGLNRATAKVQKEIFYENTVLPRLQLIEAKINYGLMKDEPRVKIMFDLASIEALQEDIERKAKIARMRKDEPLTINERREYWDLPEATGEYVDDILLTGPAEVAGTVLSSTRGRGRSRRYGKDVPLAGDPAAYLPDAAESLLDQRVVHTANIPDLVVEGGTRGSDIALSLGFEVPEDWIGRYNFQRTIDSYVSQRLGENIGRGIVHTIDQVTRDSIINVIGSGMREGYGMEAIASQMRGEFDWMGRTRSRSIAQTEIHGAVETGQFELYKGVQVPKKRWLAHPGQMNPRDWHLKTDAKYVDGIPTEKPFIMAVTGNSMMHPGDPGGLAVEVINCHCDLVPMNDQGKAANYTLKEFLDWEQALLEEGAGARYVAALVAFFQREKKRYLDHFYTLARVEEET